MGRKCVDDKKIKLTIRLKESTILQLKSMSNYNQLIQELLDLYFKDKKL